MGNKISYIIFAIVVILLYILIFNLTIYSIDYLHSNSDVGFNTPPTSENNIGFGDSVGIEVRGERFFGLAELRQSGAEERQKILYIFHVLPLPLQFSGINFKWFHSIFFISIFLILIIFFVKPVRGNYLE